MPRMLKEVTTQRRMPPWHADPRHGTFANDRRLTDKEIETLAAWVDAGTPRGDDKDLPKPVAWVKGWTHGKPDLVLQMPQEFEVPADGVLPYKHFTIDPGFKEDVWVEKGEARPGVAGVVHHVVVYILKPGQRPAVRQPGQHEHPRRLGARRPRPAMPARHRTAHPQRLEAHVRDALHAQRQGRQGSLVDRPHLHQEAAEIRDADELVYERVDPHSAARSALPGGSVFRFRADARIISFVPHMHWRGKDYFYELIYPDGRKRDAAVGAALGLQLAERLSVRRADQGAQGQPAARRRPLGQFAQQSVQPRSDKEVRFGLQTWEEMMVGWAVYTWERPDTAEKLAREKVHPAEQMFDRLDRNGDDVITPDEIPEQLKLYLKLQGIKMPERITQGIPPRLRGDAQRFQKPKPKPPASEKDKKSSP